MQVTSSVAISLDGFIDDSSTHRLILSNREDLEAVDLLRASHHAILVGAGTLRTDNPSLSIKTEAARTLRKEKGLPPELIKVTITHSGNLDPNLNFFNSPATHRFVFAPEKTGQELTKKFASVATVIGYTGDEISPILVLKELLARGVNSLLIEGGQRIHTLFLEADLVNELRVAIAPFFVGDPTAPRFVGAGRFPYQASNRLPLAKVEKIGDMAVLHYKLKPH